MAENGVGYSVDLTASERSTTTPASSCRPFNMFSRLEQRITDTIY